MQEDVLNLLAARRGHFLLESGHHGELWLDLESLCRQPRLVWPIATELAKRLSNLDPDVICGPLIEGAFVGLVAAQELGVAFCYSKRYARGGSGTLFRVGYRLPDAFRNGVRGKRVAIVNDVINAGSAVRGTFTDLREHGAEIVAIGALLVLGTAAQEFAAGEQVVLEAIASLPNRLWTAEGCPLCAACVPLEDAGGFRELLGSGAPIL